MTYEIRTAAPDAERAVFIGDPGSGKTTLIQVFISSAQSVVVLDSKGIGEWDPFAATYGYVKTSDPDDVLRHPRVLFVVPKRWLLDRAGWRRPGTPGWEWTRTLQNVQQRGNTVVVWDEMMHTLPSVQAHDEARIIYTQGRARGLPCFGGSQAPVHVDTVALEESEHFFGFAIWSPTYLKAIASRRGIDPAPLTNLGPHEFGYHRKGMRELELFDPVTPLKMRTPSRVAQIEPGPETQDGVRLTP